MKTMRKITSICAGVALMAGLVFTSCQKGEVGPKGDTGAAGANGNANVVSSSITSGSWTYVDPSWEMTFTYPAITQSILDKGAVLVYVQSGTNYYQLPYTFYPTSTYSRTYAFVHYLGGLKVFVSDSDRTQGANPGTLTFKVVVIASSQIVSNPNVNYDDYNEVKKAFNLKD